MAGLKGLGKIEITPLPDKRLHLRPTADRPPDGTSTSRQAPPSPEAPPDSPHGAVKSPGRHHRATPEHLKSPSTRAPPTLDIDGNLYDNTGNLVQKGANDCAGGTERDRPTRTPGPHPLETPARQPCGGAGARVGEVADALNSHGGSSNNDLGRRQPGRDSVPDGPIGKAENQPAERSG
ncbi:hypothetical protein GCM10020227_27650 [Streptomyces flavovirens]